MPPVTIEGAIPSAIRQRIADWAATEVTVNPDGSTSAGISMEWSGFVPAPAWESTRRAKVEITVAQGVPITTQGYLTGLDMMGQTHRFTGEAVVTLREPAGDGDGPLLEAAGRLAGYFRGWPGPQNPQIGITGVSAPTSTTATAPWIDCILRIQFEALAAFAAVAP